MAFWPKIGLRSQVSNLEKFLWGGGMLAHPHSLTFRTWAPPTSWYSCLCLWVFTVILSQNWYLSQCGDIRPLSVFIAPNSPWSIKLFTELPGCCPLCRMPISNVVRMCTCSLVPNQRCLRWVDGDLNANEEFIRRYNTVQIDSATLVQVVQLKDRK